MNILFLALDIDLGSRTGDCIHVRELTSSLARTGNRVLLITARPGTPDDMKWAQDLPDLQIFYTDQGRRLGNLSTVRYCKKIAKEHGVRVIYERRPSPKIGYALSKLLKIPLLVEINAIVEDEKALISGDDQEDVAFRDLRHRMRTRFYRHAAMVVAVTDGIKKHIHTTYDVPEARIAVVPNGANTGLFKPMDRETCIDTLGLDSGKQYICFTGNLAPWQGLTGMIEAMPLIMEERRDTVFLVVGGGREKENLENKARAMNLEDNVVFTGWVDYERVPFYINASEVCVAPMGTGRERSGSSALKIFEYLACGKPTVATDVPDLDFLEKEGCGVLVPRGDESDLARAVLDLLADRKRSETMGVSGMSLVKNRYSWDATARKVNDLITGAVGQRS